MLEITIKAAELYDESKEEFITSKEQVLQLEHSLVSLSKWESIWCKPFITKTTKTIEETVDYIRCMTLTQNVSPNVYRFLNQENVDAVSKYIDAPMTATTFAKSNDKVTNRETITAEIIYYWMITLNVPFECQKWHLNRLLTLINVCNLKNQPAKKMSQKDILSQQRALNEARRLQYNSHG
jgi:hypothetical protein